MGWNLISSIGQERKRITQGHQREYRKGLRRWTTASSSPFGQEQGLR
jgi:hypothetical protein